MIRHTVILKLKFPQGSSEEQHFFQAAGKLEFIPGVKKFECLRQTSAKNNFDFGISMEFDSKKLYDDYSNHPEHLQFVREYWVNFVKDFMEIDYEPL